MQRFQNTVTIAQPVGDVFAFLADLRNIPRLNYAIARTVPTSPDPAGAGATYRQTRTIPRRSEESLQITVFQLGADGERVRPVLPNAEIRLVPTAADCEAALGPGPCGGRDPTARLRSTRRRGSPCSPGCADGMPGSVVPC
jgi:hypothetical protein